MRIKLSAVFTCFFGVVVGCSPSKKVDIEAYELHEMRNYVSGELDFELGDAAQITYKKGKLKVKSRLVETSTKEGLEEAFFVVKNRVTRDSIYAFSDEKGYFDVSIQFDIASDTLIIGQLGMVDKYYGFLGNKDR